MLRRFNPRIVLLFEAVTLVGAVGPASVAAAPPGKVTRLTNDGRCFAPMTTGWSPDGRRILFGKQFGRDAQGTMMRQLWVMNADGSGAKPISKIGCQKYCRWSPDGKKIVYAYAEKWDRQSQGTFYVYDVGTDQSRPLISGLTWARYATKTGFADVDWTRDSKQFTLLMGRMSDNTERADAYLCDVESGRYVGLTPNEYTTGGYYAVSWSPDDSQLATRARSTADSNYRLWICNRDGSNLHAITPADINVACSPMWSPKGDWITFTTTYNRLQDEQKDELLDIWLIRPDGRDAHPITHGSSPSLAKRMHYTLPKWVAGGKYIMCQTLRFDEAARRYDGMCLVDPQTEEIIPILDNDPQSDQYIYISDYGISISPDGQKIGVLVIQYTVRGRTAANPVHEDPRDILYYYDIPSRTLHEVDRSRPIDDGVSISTWQGTWYPHWSPDGDKLLYVRAKVISYTDGKFEPDLHIYHLKPTEAGQPTAAQPPTTPVPAAKTPQQPAVETTGQPPRPERAVVGIEGKVTRLTDDGRCYSPIICGWSPDGSKILFAKQFGKDTQGNLIQQLWVMNADGSGARSISRVGWQVDCGWSPDSKSIVYACVERQEPDSQGTLYLYDVASDQSRQLISGLTWSRLSRIGWGDVAWTQDCKEFAMLMARVSGTRPSEAYLFNVESGRHVGLTPNQYSTGGYYVVSRSPDDSQLATRARATPEGNHRLWICNRDGSNLHAITPADMDVACSPMWSPKGDWITFTTTYNRLQDEQRDTLFDIWLIRPDGRDAHPITHGSSPSLAKRMHYTLPKWVAGGKYIMCQTLRFDEAARRYDGMCLVDPQTEEIIPILDNDPQSDQYVYINDAGISISPDGQKIGVLVIQYTVRGRTAGNPVNQDPRDILYYYDIPSRTLHEVDRSRPVEDGISISSDQYSWHPHWSPDGEKLLFVRAKVISYTDGKFEPDLYIYHLKPTEAAQPAAAQPTTPPVPAISPAPVVTTAQRPASEVTAQLPRPEQTTAGIEGNVARLTDDGRSYTRVGLGWSPDGRYVLFSKQYREGTQLWLANADGTGAKAISSVGWQQDYGWSPDGSKVVYVHAQDRVGTLRASLYVYDLSSGVSRQLDPDFPLIQYDSSTGFAIPEWSPDSTRFVLLINGSPSGGPRTDAFLFDLDTGKFTRLTPNNDATGFLYAGSWSPDGRRFALTSRASATSDYRIWITDREGTSLDPITRADWNVTSDPRWSPNGDWIAFATTNGRLEDEKRMGLADLWLVRPDGKEAHPVTRGSSQNVADRVGFADPNWTSDGRYLVTLATRFDAAGFSYGSIELVDPTSGETITVLRNDPNSDQVIDGYREKLGISPNGQMLAFTTRQHTVLGRKTGTPIFQDRRDSLYYYDIPSRTLQLAERTRPAQDGIALWDEGANWKPFWSPGDGRLLFVRARVISLEGRVFQPDLYVYQSGPAPAPEAPSPEVEEEFVPGAAVLIKPEHRRASDIALALPQSYSAIYRLDAALNAFVVSAPDEATLDAITRDVALLDRPLPQIMVDVLVTELTRDASKQLGLDWEYARGRFGARIPLIPGGDPGQVIYEGVGKLDKAFFVTLSALEEEGKATVRANPRVLCLSGAEATINIRRTDNFLFESGTDYQGKPVRQRSDISADTILKIVPQLLASSKIAMKLDATVDSFIFGAKNELPDTTRRQATTDVIVGDGETIIIGGLTLQEDTKRTRKTPVLGDLPIIGGLFQNTSRSKRESTLVIFVSPLVVRPGYSAGPIHEIAPTQDRRSGTMR